MSPRPFINLMQCCITLPLLLAAAGLTGESYAERSSYTEQIRELSKKDAGIRIDIVEARLNNFVGCPPKATGIVFRIKISPSKPYKIVHLPGFGSAHGWRNNPLFEQSAFKNGPIFELASIYNHGAAIRLEDNFGNAFQFLGAFVQNPETTIYPTEPKQMELYFSTRPLDLTDYLLLTVDWGALGNSSPYKETILYRHTFNKTPPESALSKCESTQKTVSPDSPEVQAP